MLDSKLDMLWKEREVMEHLWYAGLRLWYKYLSNNLMSTDQKIVLSARISIKWKNTNLSKSLKDWIYLKHFVPPAPLAHTLTKNQLVQPFNETSHSPTSLTSRPFNLSSTKKTSRHKCNSLFFFTLPRVMGTNAVLYAVRHLFIYFYALLAKIIWSSLEKKLQIVILLREKKKHDWELLLKE